MITKNTLHLAEIFYSIQGEGFHAGTPAVFIRTAGCNLACDFCDTDFSVKIKSTPKEVFQIIQKFPCRFVIFTGGEPCLQINALNELADLLKSHAYYIAMETNGDFIDTPRVDWITVSPKLSQKGIWKLKAGHELKLVYENQNLNSYLDSNFEHYFLQPKEIRTEKWGKGARDEPASRLQKQATLNAVLDNSPWKLSLQLHKELGIR